MCAEDTTDNPFFPPHSDPLNYIDCLAPFFLALISAPSINIYLKTKIYYLAWLQVSAEIVLGQLKYL